MEVRELLEAMWHHDALHRPTAEEVCSVLENRLAMLIEAGVTAGEELDYASERERTNSHERPAQGLAAVRSRERPPLPHPPLTPSCACGAYPAIDRLDRAEWSSESAEEFVSADSSLRRGDPRGERDSTSGVTFSTPKTSPMPEVPGGVPSLPRAQPPASPRRGTYT